MTNQAHEAQNIDQFLASVEKKALRIAEFATKDVEEALDIVQDAMIKLVTNYQDRDAASWTPLFYRILQTKILDWHRKKKVRRIMKRLVGIGETENNPEGVSQEHITDPLSVNPAKMLTNERANKVLIQQIEALSIRQQQAFLLRFWEGLSVADTALAMSCSEGSVKTHYARALSSLRNALGDHVDFDAARLDK